MARWLRISGVATLGIALCPSTAIAQLRASVNARAFQPGEVVVVTILAPPQTVEVSVSALGEQHRAAQLDEGTWQALFGIDLAERPGSSEIVVTARTRPGAVTIKEPLKTTRKSFPVRVLKVDQSFVDPSASALERIRDESAFLQGVYRDPSREQMWREPFERPVPGPSNGRFGARSVFNGQARSPHGGADFLSDAGTPVKAPNAGRVVAARDLFFTGNTVVIDHGGGVFSLLAHLSRMDVAEGDRVSAGAVIGAVGSTGRVTGPHLHWAVRVGRARVDPLSLLAVMGSGEDRLPPR